MLSEPPFLKYALSASLTEASWWGEIKHNCLHLLNICTLPWLEPGCWSAWALLWQVLSWMPSSMNINGPSDLIPFLPKIFSWPYLLSSASLGRPQLVEGDMLEHSSRTEWMKLQIVKSVKHRLCPWVQIPLATEWAWMGNSLWKYLLWQNQLFINRQSYPVFFCSLANIKMFQTNFRLISDL